MGGRASITLETVERVVTIVLGILGLIAFVWQIQERRAANKESFEVAPLVLKLPADDSSYSFSLQILNSSSKPLNIRGAYLEGKPAVVPIYGDSTRAGITIEPQKFVTFTSVPVDESTAREFTADSASVHVQTFKAQYARPIDGSSVRLAFQLLDLARSTSENASP